MKVGISLHWEVCKTTVVCEGCLVELCVEEERMRAGPVRLTLHSCSNKNTRSPTYLLFRTTRLATTHRSLGHAVAG